MAMTGRRLPGLLVLLLLAAGCGGSGPLASSTDEPVRTAPTGLDPGMTWQWQLVGPVNLGYDVGLYDVDLFDVPAGVIDDLHARGRIVICYFSAGSAEDFRDDAQRFTDAERGRTLDGVPDEQWLDTRSPNVLAVIEDRLDLAAAKGCDGVEPDNVDGYANDTGFQLTPADQLAFNRAVAAAARERGLLVGLKNDVDQLGDLAGEFDFAVNEQCHEFDECDAYRAFVAGGKPVFNAEYADRFVDDAEARAAMCAASRDLGIRTLVLPLDLDDSFRFSCDG